MSDDKISSSATPTTAQQLEAAAVGFDHLFGNDLDKAQVVFASDKTSPFHLTGLGVAYFLEAALGMETSRMVEAAQYLNLAEAASRKASKEAVAAAGTGSGWGFYAAKPTTEQKTRFPVGLEMDILNADAVVLLGITHALSESYMGYMQCMYSLNSAHSKFTKLYKAVFPVGLDGYLTPSATPSVSRRPSDPNLASSAASVASSISVKTVPGSDAPPVKSSSVFGRWGGGASASVGASPSGSTLAVPGTVTAVNFPEDGIVEEMIISGTAFGYGLFNLIFSLLPKGVQSVVGFLGFKHDRKLALQALTVSAGKEDSHSVFAGLVLMTYYGIVLLVAGWQADEKHIVKQYLKVCNHLETRYPTGSLWILNRAKVLRMTHNPAGAIAVLETALAADPGKQGFKQAATLLVFELAWSCLGERRYAEAAEHFLKMNDLNQWSHGTYTYLAAGCLLAVGETEKAQKLFDQVPELMEKKKIGGKGLPMEIIIKKKLDFYKEKQRRRGGDPAKYVESMKINPAEELSIFWNTHTRITSKIAVSHIQEWLSLTPASTITSPYAPAPAVEAAKDALEDLDNPEDLALRSLLLGITHRTTGDYHVSRQFFTHATQFEKSMKASNWLPGLVWFETAILDLKEMEAADGGSLHVQISTAAASSDALAEDDDEAELMRKKTSLVETERAIDALSPAHLPNEERVKRWKGVLEAAVVKLDKAMSLSGSAVDLSSRLDSRVAMVKGEIAAKREALGIV